MQESASNKTSKRQWVKFFVTFLGSGLAPKAPGTFGSLATLPLIIVLALSGIYVYFSFTIIFIAVSLWMVALYLRQNGDNQDPKEVVVDEVAGMLVTFFLVPLTPMTLVTGFVLFRLFDILKPPPISTLDKNLPGAAGVMADDLLAGFVANMIFLYVLIPQGWIW